MSSRSNRSHRAKHPLLQHCISFEHDLWTSISQCEKRGMVQDFRHRRWDRRRWMSPAFSAESLKANESSVIDIIDRFCETLKPKDGGWGEKWNASEMSTYLGFDIMGALVFGADFKTVQEEKNRDLADSVLPASMLMYWVCTTPSRRWICTDVAGIVLTSGLLSPPTSTHQLFRKDWRQVRSGQQSPY
jgi:cytochrome P450